jgi:exodeoxyribonuclease V alpha subunit
MNGTTDGVSLMNEIKTLSTDKELKETARSDVTQHVFIQKIVTNSLFVTLHNTESHNTIVMLKDVYKCEQRICDKLRTINKAEFKLTKANVERSIKVFERKNSLRLTKQQHQAVISAVYDDNVSLIVGGPGCGKSLVNKCIEYVCKEEEVPYVICAPTGKASSKLKGRTIHKIVFGYKNERSFMAKQCKKEMKLEFVDEKDVVHIKPRVVIVDEASMADILIMEKLLLLCKDESRFVVVGDDIQLPSISAGDFLRDLISCGKFAINPITENKRMDSYMHALAQAIRGDTLEKEIQLLTNSANDQITFININHMDKESDDEVLRKGLELWKKHGGEDQKSFQIITPYNMKLTKFNQKCWGRQLWNNEIHKILQNGSWERYVRGEKLICCKSYESVNDTNKMVISKGTICEFYGKNGVQAMVLVGEDVLTLPYSHLDYAHGITVHSSQGDEFDYVLVIVPFYTKDFFTKELLYTSLTRGKKHMYVVSSPEVIIKSCQNKRRSRQTASGMMLKDELVATIV